MIFKLLDKIEFEQKKNLDGVRITKKQAIKMYEEIMKNEFITEFIFILEKQK